MNIEYKKVKMPVPDGTNVPVMLSDETMKDRFKRVIQRMVEEQIDTLVIYADLEHGSNFEYLTGFLPRFEEALLIIHQDETCQLMMGNENLNKVSHARLQAEAIHVPHFSLPNQPMGKETLSSIMKHTNIKQGECVGIVGWKLFTSQLEDHTTYFDIPHYLLVELAQLVGNNGKLINATSMMIGEHGVRCRNNVNELEHYEFGASLASDRLLIAMNHLAIGVDEMSLGNDLNAYGQRNSVVTIASTGPRFLQANLYPTNRKVALGDPISLTVGYKGGLSSRAGYAVHDADQLPAHLQDYIKVLVKPYYACVVAWLETIHCGIKGGAVYDMVKSCLPKETYHWSLCPGHLSADEEWMSSPIYEGSQEVLQSGMLVQIDIIPSIQGYAGSSVEGTIALGDEVLREQLATQAPALWNRIQKRRTYIENELHMKLSADILPMSSTVAYLRPFLLNKEYAMVVE